MSVCVGENDKEIINILKKILQMWPFKSLTFTLYKKD